MKIKDKTHEPRTRTRYLGKRAKQRQWQRVIGQKGGEEWEIEHLAETVAVFYFDAFFGFFFFQCFARCIFNRLVPWWRYCPEYIDDVLLWHQGHLRLFWGFLYSEWTSHDPEQNPLRFEMLIPAHKFSHTSSLSSHTHIIWIWIRINFSCYQKRKTDKF